MAPPKRGSQKRLCRRLLHLLMQIKLSREELHVKECFLCLKHSLMLSWSNLVIYLITLKLLETKVSMIFLKSTSTIEFEELHVAYLSSLPELENIEEENKLLDSEEKYYNEVCSVAQNMIESFSLYESSFKDFDDLKSDSAQNKNETEPKAVATKLVQDNVVVAERTFKRSLLAYVTNKEDAQGLVNKIGDLNYSGMVELEEIRGLPIFSCDSSSISHNVCLSVGRSVGLSVCRSVDNEFYRCILAL